MAQHDRAWSGLDICIVGSAPMLPMRLEQTLAAALPAHEARLESFENYNDAFDFCRQSRGVGLVILLDEQQVGTTGQVFAALARHYEQRGLPCLGVVVSKGTSAPHAAFSDRRLFTQISLDAFKDAATAAVTMESVWQDYIHAFQSIVVPEALQESLEAAATDAWPEATLIFFERTVNALSLHLNLTWIEMVACRMFLVLDGVGAAHGIILRPHPVLKQLATMVEPKHELLTLALPDQCTASAPLAQRLVAVCKTLALAHRNSGTETFDIVLKSLPATTSPGTGIFLKHLVATRSRIEEFALSAVAGHVFKAS